MSNYPNIHFSSQPKFWEDNKWMVDATLRQVEKDFRLQAIELNLDSKAETYSDLVNELALKLDQLEFAHHPRFVSVLYQIDISQKDITQKMAQISPESFYILLADEVLKRCFLKVYWRRRMKEEGESE